MFGKVQKTTLPILRRALLSQFLPDGSNVGLRCASLGVFAMPTESFLYFAILAVHDFGANYTKPRFAEVVT